jgi:hypothetical protein
MRFGINTFLFSSPFTNRSTALFPKFRRRGFDSVEIAIEDLSHIEPAKVRAIARAAAIWRKIEPAREEIAVKGLKFLKKVFA